MAERKDDLGARLARALGWELLGDGDFAHPPEGGVVWVKWLCSEWSGLAVLLEHVLRRGYAVRFQPDAVYSNQATLTVLPRVGLSWEVHHVPLDDVPIWFARLAVRALEEERGYDDGYPV